MKFLADCTLGKLVLWLRILGYDTTYCEKSINRSLMNQGLVEKRIVLTRRRDMARRRYSGRMIILLADRVWDQLAELREKVNLHPLPELLFSRCVHCNSELQKAGRTDVAGKVPPYILHTHDHFHTCQLCGRIFWPGTHRERMLGAMIEHNLIHHP